MHNGEKTIKISFDNGTETTCYPGTQIRNIIKKFDVFVKGTHCLGALG